MGHDKTNYKFGIMWTRNGRVSHTVLCDTHESTIYIFPVDLTYTKSIIDSREPI